MSSKTIQLGVQSDGTALVAVWLAPVAAERWRAKLGDLPETARGCEPRSRSERLIFRVPPGCIRVDEQVLTAADDMLIEHYGPIKFDGGEIAQLPVQWLSWMITQGALLDVNLGSR
jgi:hypothetical protein